MIELTELQLDQIATNIDNRQLMSINQVCKFLDISRKAFYNLRREKLIKPDIYINNSPRWLKGTILKAINGQN